MIKLGFIVHFKHHLFVSKTFKYPFFYLSETQMTLTVVTLLCVRVSDFFFWLWHHTHWPIPSHPREFFKLKNKSRTSSTGSPLLTISTSFGAGCCILASVLGLAAHLCLSPWAPRSQASLLEPTRQSFSNVWPVLLLCEHSVSRVLLAHFLRCVQRTTPWLFLPSESEQAILLPPFAFSVWRSSLSDHTHLSSQLLPGSPPMAQAKTGSHCLITSFIC